MHVRGPMHTGRFQRIGVLSQLHVSTKKASTDLLWPTLTHRSIPNVVRCLTTAHDRAHQVSRQDRRSNIPQVVHAGSGGQCAVPGLRRGRFVKE